MKNYDKIAKQIYEYENAQYRLETGSTLGSLAGKKQKKADAGTAAKTGLPKTIEKKVETDIKYRVDNRANTDLKYLRENINSRLTVSLALLAGDKQNYAIDLCGINNEKAEDLELLAKIMLDRSKQLFAKAAPDDQNNIQKNIHNLEETLSLIKHYSSTFFFSSGAKESRLLEDGFKESKETQLFEAILANNSSRVQKLISDTPDILKATDMHGDTPLMMAVKLKRYDFSNNIISTIAKVLGSHTELNSSVLAHKNKYGLNVLDIAGDKERKVYKQLEKHNLSDEQKSAPKESRSDEINEIKVNINKAFTNNDFQWLNGLIARSTLIGEVKAILNHDLDSDDDKPLIHKIISMPAEIDGEKQKGNKLKTFKMLLDAGADPDIRSGDSKSLFQTIIEASSGGKANLEYTAIKMLEELTRRGIKAPDDEGIIIAACTSTNPKRFVTALYDNGFRTGDSNDVKTKLLAAKIDEPTIKKITTAVSSEAAPSLVDKIIKTNAYRDNLVWDWLRVNRPEKQRIRIGASKSTTAINESKKELKDMDRSRIKKDISFSLTQKDSWEDNLKALETLHNAVMVLCEIDPLFKQVYALHENKHTKDYYKNDNIEALKKLVISQLEGKISIENDKNPSTHKEGQLKTQTLADLLIAQQEAVSGSTFPKNKLKTEMSPPPYAKIQGVAQKGYNAHINKYRTDGKHQDLHHRDARNQGPIVAISADDGPVNLNTEGLPEANATVTGGTQMRSSADPEIPVQSTEVQQLKASFTKALDGDSAEDLKDQIKAVNGSRLIANEKLAIFNTKRDSDGKTAYHLVSDYYLHGDDIYGEKDNTELLSMLSTNNISIKTLTDNKGLSMQNYMKISLISIYKDDNENLEKQLESIQTQDNYAAILRYNVDGKTISDIFEEAGLQPIAIANAVDTSVTPVVDAPVAQHVVPEQNLDKDTQVTEAATTDANQLAPETQSPEGGVADKKQEIDSPIEDIHNKLAEKFKGSTFDLNELSEEDIGKIREAIKTPNTEISALLDQINNIRPGTPIIKPPPPRSASPKASTTENKQTVVVKETSKLILTLNETEGKYTVGTKAKAANLSEENAEKINKIIKVQSKNQNLASIVTNKIYEFTLSSDANEANTKQLETSRAGTTSNKVKPTQPPPPPPSPPPPSHSVSQSASTSQDSSLQKTDETNKSQLNDSLNKMKDEFTEDTKAKAANLSEENAEKINKTIKVQSQNPKLASIVTSKINEFTPSADAKPAAPLTEDASHDKPATPVTTTASTTVVVEETRKLIATLNKTEGKYTGDTIQKAANLSEENAEKINKIIKVQPQNPNLAYMVTNKINEFTPSSDANEANTKQLETSRAGTTSNKVKPTQPPPPPPPPQGSQKARPSAQHDHLEAIRNARERLKPSTAENKQTVVVEETSKGASKRKDTENTSVPNANNSMFGSSFLAITSRRDAIVGENDLGIDDIDDKLKQHEATDGQYKDVDLDKDTLKSYKKIVESAQDDAQSTIDFDSNDEETEAAEKQLILCIKLLQQIDSAIESKSDNTPTKGGPGAPN